MPTDAQPHDRPTERNDRSGQQSPRKQPASLCCGRSAGPTLVTNYFVQVVTELTNRLSWEGGGEVLQLIGMGGAVEEV